MPSSRFLAVLTLAACAASASASVRAEPITQLPGGESLALPSPAAVGVGSFALGRGVVLATTHANALVGWSGALDFGTNGSWSGAPAIALNHQAGVFELVFDDPISGFLAEFNWTTGAHAGNASLEALNAAGETIESLVFEKKGGDVLEPGFHGLLRATEDIARLRFNNESIAIRNLSFAGLSAPVSAIPEPGTLALAGLAMLGVVATARRGRRATPTPSATV